MDVLLSALFFVAGTVVCCYILYLIIKAAVRDGITQARHHSDYPDEQDTVSKITCPDCGKNHAMDYPKYPYCGHVNFEL